MKLSKAKELIENGTHYIFKDIDKNFSSDLIILSNTNYGKIMGDRKVIYTSEITDDEEIAYQMQVDGEWRDCVRPIRIKPKPDFSKELEAMKENIMKVIVTFENNL